MFNPDPDFVSIPDPGVKKHKIPDRRSATVELKTAEACVADQHLVV
jgi:hypothetical protein